MSKIYNNNKSGVPGVCFKVRDAKWTAAISVNGTKVILGNFRKKEEAIEARQLAEKFYKHDIKDLKGFTLIHHTLIINLKINRENPYYDKYYNDLIPCLYYCAYKYQSIKSSISFSRFATENLTEIFKNNQLGCEIDLSNIDTNVDYFKDWINGESIALLSTKYDIPQSTLNKMINNMCLKINFKLFEKKVLTNELK